MYAHVYTHVNSTDMNDYQLQQVCDQHLDIICPKLRPVNRQRKNSISTLLSTPTLPKLVIFFSRCVPFHSRCALGFSHLLSSQMLKGIRVFSYIQTKITNHICASFARNVNRICASYCQSLLFNSCVVKPIKWYTDSFKTWVILICVCKQSLFVGGCICQPPLLF